MNEMLCLASLPLLRQNKRKLIEKVEDKKIIIIKEEGWHGVVDEKVNPHIGTQFFLGLKVQIKQKQVWKVDYIYL